MGRFKLLCLVVGFFLFSAIGHAATITLDPLNSPVAIGSEFTISVLGMDFPTTTGGDVQVNFDSNLLEALGVTNTFPGDTNGSAITNDFVSISSGDFGAPNPSGDFGIADIKFMALNNIGISALTLSITSPWLDANFNSLTDQPDLISGGVNVIVPIPSTIILLGGGLIGLIGLRRRRS